MHWVEVNGVSLRYRSEGVGPPLVLIHEIGGTLESWDGLAPALAERFQLLRYDQRGSGGSEKVRHPFGLTALVSDLDALLEKLDLPPPFHLVGAALGAAQAVILAAHRPGQVGSLVLLNPALEVDASRSALMRSRALRAEQEGLRATLSLTLDRSWPPGDSSPTRETYRARYLANDPYGFARQNEALLDLSTVLPPLREIRCPTLVLAGARDAVRPPPLVRQAADAIPGSRFAILDTAHFMAAEAPGPLSEELRRFYDGILTAAAA